MREILFRGKRINSMKAGEWAEGFFMEWLNPCKNRKEARIQTISEGGCIDLIHEVDPSTVGQYTGLKDKNGKRIFEGDVFAIEDEIVAVVIFTDGGFRLEEWGFRGTFTESGYDECGGSWGKIGCEPIDWYIVHHMEVIGNTHDNGELMEVRRWNG